LTRSFRYSPILLILLTFSLIIAGYGKFVNSEVIQRPINVNNFPPAKVNAEDASGKQEPVLNESLQGAIVGGIIGFVSAIVVDEFRTWRNRPILEILEETTEKTFDYNRHKVATGVKADEFTATRIKIKNKGETAAENCKATLIIDEDEFRIGWMIPRDDLTVTINAHDTEFIDLCAIAYRNNSWVRIFTTERGYGENQKAGRTFQNNDNNMISGQLKISSKNSKTCLKSIWILDHPNGHNRMVNFHRPQ
jgi:hypothetical protein